VREKWVMKILEKIFELMKECLKITEITENMHVV